MKIITKVIRTVVRILYTRYLAIQLCLASGLQQM